MKQKQKGSAKNCLSTGASRSGSSLEDPRIEALVEISNQPVERIN